MSAANPHVADKPPGGPGPRSRLGLRLLLVLAVGATLAAFYFLGGDQYLSWDYLRGQLDTLQGQVRENLAVVLLAFLGLYVIVTALSLPVAAALTLAGSGIFGPALGRIPVTLLVDLAATCGATLAFLSSRFLFRAWVQNRFAQRLGAINRGVEKDGGYYLFTLRLLPVFPFFLINVGMGLTVMRTWTFMWVSFVGMLPGTFVYTNVGTELGSIESPGQVFSPGVLISLALLGLLPLVLSRFLRRKT